MAFQLARSEITFVFFLEWSGRASLPFLFREHCIPPLAMLHGSPELCYVTKAVCSMSCLWERKSSNPKSCLSACQLSPSPQALGDTINISGLDVGPLQLHQDRRGGSLPWTLDLQLHKFRVVALDTRVQCLGDFVQSLLAAGSSLESGLY